MKVQITGISGFVGTNLKNYFIDNQNVRVHELNLRSDSWHIDNNTNAIIHLAGKAHDLKKTSSPDEYYEINQKLTQKLYDDFIVSNATVFIFISSVKAAADKVNGVLYEDADTHPQTDYGKSKLFAEQYIQRQVLPDNKSYYILRPSMIHGPGNKGNLNLLYSFIRRGMPYPLAAFKNKRSYLSVANLCFIINCLLQSNIDSGVYNVADDESLSTSDVITIMSNASGKKPKLWNIYPKIIYFLAKIGDKLNLPLTIEKLEKMTESYIVSNQKIKESLKIEMPFTAKEGLIETAHSFLVDDAT